MSDLSLKASQHPEQMVESILQCGYTCDSIQSFNIFQNVPDPDILLSDGSKYVTSPVLLLHLSAAVCALGQMHIYKS
jgi:hypothetical protein